MEPTTMKLLCLVIVLAVGVSSVHGSYLKKRNTNRTKVVSQESVANNDVDNADHEENDAAEEDRNVRNRAQNVLQVFLEIHNHNARNKKSNSKKVNDRSSESFVTVYESRKGKKNGKEKTPTFAHVVAVRPGRFNVMVGFNGNGVINGTWKVAAQNGSVNFNNDTSLIEIERDGFYSFYASIYYSYRTSLAMSHCVGVIKDGEMDNERKQCATSASSYRYADRNWGHSGSNFARGVYYLKRGEFVGVRMNASEMAPESNAIAFVPDQCYFGVERK